MSVSETETYGVRRRDGEMEGGGPKWKNTAVLLTEESGGYVAEEDVTLGAQDVMKYVGSGSAATAQHNSH